MIHRKSISAAGSVSPIISIVIVLMVILTAGCHRAHDSTESNSPNWAQGEWQLISELPGDVYYNALSFSDEKNGWVVGMSGRILHTTDGGGTWDTQESGISVDLTCVYFANDQLGWVGGSDGSIGRTTDGGASWTWQHPETTRTFLAIYFVDDHTGWIVGSGGGILHTTDGGVTWVPQDSGTTGPISSVQFLDSKEGWAIGLGLVLHTTDGGENWGTTHLNDIDYGIEYRGANILLSGIFFVDADTGWIGTDMSTSDVTLPGLGEPVLHTTDGGSTWQIQGSMPGSVRCLVFADKDNGWAAGGGTVSYTHDGGNSWTSQVSGGIFRDLCLASRDHLWALTFEGQIYQYNIS